MLRLIAGYRKDSLVVLVLLTRALAIPELARNVYLSLFIAISWWYWLGVRAEVAHLLCMSGILPVYPPTLRIAERRRRMREEEKRREEEQKSDDSKE